MQIMVHEQLRKACAGEKVKFRYRTGPVKPEKLDRFRKKNRIRNSRSPSAGTVKRFALLELVH